MAILSDIMGKIRRDSVVDICHSTGARVKAFFEHPETLKTEIKGRQDFVSQADREVELLVRKLLREAFPEDTIVGEEHAPEIGTSGFTWVIDPIDGTTNFVNGIAAWTVVIAGVEDGRTKIGVIHDPNLSDTFVAVAGEGTELNGVPLHLNDTRRISEGTVGVGYSNRVKDDGIVRLVTALVERGAMFHRNASGALSIAYVAAGRLLGYSEEHMNVRDCLAGQLIVAEAGGVVEAQDANEMIERGGRVVVATPAVFDDLLAISEAAFSR